MKACERSGLIMIIFMALYPLYGCATPKKPIPPRAFLEGDTKPFYPGQIIHLETANAVSFDQLIDQLEEEDLIFIGEIHNDPDHHLIQVQILQAVIERYGTPAVAMEFFGKPRQDAIDRYLAGQTSEAEFLDAVRWSREWGYDYHFYRPLILMAKERGSEILAINAPGEIVSKVARTGLQSLTEEDRSQIAREMDLKNEKHRSYLLDVYEKHAHQDLKKFDFFYEAQCVWEETMAENIAEYLKQADRKLVVFSGNGHIIHKYGIPDRVQSGWKWP